MLGSGAAGAAATELLRREGYTGPLTLIGSEPPVDRPNLSKDYLAGNAPEEWIPLRDAEFYRSIDVELVTGDAARSIDLGGRSVTLESGRRLPFESLLYATGAEPIRLPLPGADRPEVHLLRTLDDSRAIIARAEKAKRAVVIGASFIGLEVAASLRARGVEVDVVAPEPVPLARVRRRRGRRVRARAARGARRALPSRAQADRDRGRRGDARRRRARCACDFVVMGVGVRPRLALAEAAGLTIDKGVVVDEQLARCAGRVRRGRRRALPRSAVGPADSRRALGGGRAQGQAAARNMLGAARPFRDVPFFWSAHHDVTLELRRPRRGLGCDRGARQSRGARRVDRLSPGRAGARGGDGGS